MEMSSGACGSDGSGKQPPSSIRDVFSSLFGRDRPDSAEGPAVLTAFRELPEGEDPLPDGRESKEGGRESSDAIEPEVVQVTRVETYSDTENEEEEEEASHRGPPGARGPEDELRDEGDGACEVPVFRTHNLDSSRIENMLQAEKSRRKPRLRPAGADSSGVPEGTETAGKEEPAGSEEHIACPPPGPSTISGPAGSGAAGRDAAAASPSERLEGTSGPSDGPETPRPAPRPAPSPAPSPVDQAASVGDHQPEQSAAPTTPETKAQPSDSPVPPSRGSTPPSPPSFHMPALFSGLRVLKKGAAAGDRDTTAEIKQREKDADLALLNLKKSVNKAKQTTPSPTQKLPAGGRAAAPGQPTNTSGRDADGRRASEDGDEAPGEASPGAPEKRSTSDLAYETFRSIFGPRAAKKDKTDEVDLDAVKRKIRTDKENLKSIFERVSRTPSKELKSPTEVKVRAPPPPSNRSSTRSFGGLSRIVVLV